MAAGLNRWFLTAALAGGALLAPAEGILRVSPRPDSEAAGLSVAHPALAGNVFDFRTCEAVLDGDQDFGLFRVKLAMPGETNGAAWSSENGRLSYQWRYPEGVEVRFTATPQTNRVTLAYTIFNHTPAPLVRVHLHTCVTTTEAPAFFPRLMPRAGSRLPASSTDNDHTELFSRLFLWSGGKPFRLDNTDLECREVHLALMPQGHAPIRWAWWVNATNTFDEPLIALASHDGRWTAGLCFERAAWASANAGDDRACFHLFPLFGRIEPGASASVRGAFFLLRGSPETFRVRANQRTASGQQRSSAKKQPKKDQK
jgi:hypothetical protein